MLDGNIDEASPKILFIDDEKNVLSGIQRQLRKEFSLLTATGYEEALEAVRRDKTIAVAVCDMRMPGKNGVETLAAIEKVSPDTVRVMLTGNADQQTAIDAINRGHIFRFLSKPCGDDVLRATINDALRQYELLTAEKSLLQQTLTGSVRVLVEVLSMVAPEAFSRASKARQWVRAMAEELDIGQRWDVELAAMLAPLGYVAVPAEIIAKQRRGTLSATEQEMIARVPETGQKLLANIPRLKNVAQWIGMQNETADDGMPIGARISRFVTALAPFVDGDAPDEASIRRLEEKRFEADLDIWAAARRMWGGSAPKSRTRESEEQRLRVSLSALLPNDLLLEPIMFVSGKLLLSAGSRVSAVQIERLRNLCSMEPVKEPVEVRRAEPHKLAS